MIIEDKYNYYAFLFVALITSPLLGVKSQFKIIGLFICFALIY